MTMAVRAAAGNVQFLYMLEESPEYIVFDFTCSPAKARTLA
jgi:hypothetical protein